MSTTETKTVTIIPDRTCRIIIEKPLGSTPTLLTVDEKIIDGFHQVTGNMQVSYNTENPKHVALFTALEAVIADLRVIRDTPATESLAE